MGYLKGRRARYAKVDEVCCLMQIYARRIGRGHANSPTVCYVHNRLPTKAQKLKTLYELWNGSKPSPSHLRVFGSKVNYQISKEKRKKWDNSC